MVGRARVCRVGSGRAVPRVHEGVFPVSARGSSAPWGAFHVSRKGAAEGTEDFVHKGRERVSDVPCLLLILKTLIAFHKMFPQNCKKVKSTSKEHHKQDQSQNRDSILPNQSIVSKERLHRDN